MYISDAEFKEARRIWRRYSFAELLMAATLHADMENQRRLESAFPGINLETRLRYNVGDLTEGETYRLDGEMYAVTRHGIERVAR